jgi:hypothetical protein
MRINAIGHIYDLAADTNNKPLATLPLSTQLKIERDILFGNRPKKPRGKIKHLTTPELYHIAEHVAYITAKAFDIPTLAIFQQQGLARYLAITLCYLHNGFTKKDCTLIFNCGHKLPIIAARAVEDRATIDPDFRQLYRQLIQASKNANILL